MPRRRPPGRAPRGATWSCSARASGATARSRTGSARASWSSAWRAAPPGSRRRRPPPRRRARRRPPHAATPAPRRGSRRARRGPGASCASGAAAPSPRACGWTRPRSCPCTWRPLTRSSRATHNGAVQADQRGSRRVNLPIGLTLTRIVAVPLLIVFLISSSRVHAAIAAGIFILASITDWADGMLARRRNQVTTLGTLLDPIADKLLGAPPPVSLLAIDKIAAWIVVVIIGRELAVTGLRAVAASVGVIVPASRLAKWKTVSQYVAVTMLIVEEGFDPPGFPRT